MHPMSPGIACTGCGHSRRRNGLSQSGYRIHVCIQWSLLEKGGMQQQWPPNGSIHVPDMFSVNDCSRTPPSPRYNMSTDLESSNRSVFCECGMADNVCVAARQTMSAVSHWKYCPVSDRTCALSRSRHCLLCHVADKVCHVTQQRLSAV